MKRLTALPRSLSRFIVTTALCFVGLIAAAPSAQAQGAPVEGTDYQVLTPAQPVDVPGKIEVIEFFAYWCPHCNEFEPALNNWIKAQKSDVVIRHVPVGFADNQVPYQRLYYALEALGKEGELRSKVFAAIHIDHQRLDNTEAIADFAAKNGIDRKQFLEVYNSFSVQTKVTRSRQMAEAYAISGVPTMIIGGKYSANGHAQALPLLDFLVSKVRAELPPQPVAAVKKAADKPAVKKKATEKATAQ